MEKAEMEAILSQVETFNKKIKEAMAREGATEFFLVAKISDEAIACAINVYDPSLAQAVISASGALQRLIEEQKSENAPTSTLN